MHCIEIGVGESSSSFVWERVWAKSGGYGEILSPIIGFPVGTFIRLTGFADFLGVWSWNSGVAFYMWL